MLILLGVAPNIKLLSIPSSQICCVGTLNALQLKPCLFLHVAQWLCRVHHNVAWDELRHLDNTIQPSMIILVLPHSTLYPISPTARISLRTYSSNDLKAFSKASLIPKTKWVVHFNLLSSFTPKLSKTMLLSGARLYIKKFVCSDISSCYTLTSKKCQNLKLVLQRPWFIVGTPCPFIKGFEF